MPRRRPKSPPAAAVQGLRSARDSQRPVSRAEARVACQPVGGPHRRHLPQQPADVGASHMRSCGAGRGDRVRRNGEVSWATGRAGWWLLGPRQPSTACSSARSIGSAGCPRRPIPCECSRLPWSPPALRFDPRPRAAATAPGNESAVVRNSGISSPFPPLLWDRSFWDEGPGQLGASDSGPAEVCVCTS